MFKVCGRRRRKDDGVCLYFKLTYEPKGSGELKCHFTKRLETTTKDFMHGKFQFQITRCHLNTFLHLLDSLVGRNTFLSSPHLCFIVVFIYDLFVSRDDPLMS